MKMIKKYWWLILAGGLIYWKWDKIGPMLGFKPKETTTGSDLVEYGPMNLPETDKPFETDANEDSIPDYLQPKN